MNVLDKVCKWAFKPKALEKYSKISLNRAAPCWVKNTSLRFPITLDEYDLQRILHWLFNYNIVQLGTKCFSQMKGISMGFSCSPIMCNIYFAYFEYKFYVNHSNAWDKDLLEGLKHSYRYMDDFLSLNNKNFKIIL